MRETPTLPPPADGGGEALVVHTRHGFGNRIRSIASAVWLAAEVGRRLHVRWEISESCGASLEDLFERDLLGGVGSLRVNSLTAIAASACASERGVLSRYEPLGNRCCLYASHLRHLPDDPAPVVVLAGASLPATLRGKQLCRPPPTWSPDAKEERANTYEMRLDAGKRAAFYRALVPSAGVSAFLAPALARIDAARAAAAAAGAGLQLVGVHVRQGDALDAVNGFFNSAPSAHDDAYVDKFAAAMLDAAARAAAAGKQTAFFVASDQRRARRQLRGRVGGSHAVIEVPQGRHGGGDGGGVDDGDGVGGDGSAGEGREERDLRGVQRAVAEWVLLARADVIVRSRESSFSAEAALVHRTKSVNVEPVG